MEIIIKGMVCHHCVEAVSHILKTAGLTPENVTLGRAVIMENPDDIDFSRLDKMLESEGFSRMLDADAQLVERTKQAIIKHIRQPHECRLNLSKCLEETLAVPYDTISRVFSSHEGRTIEKYQMAQRVEWVKELLGYGQMTASEIADYTGYSSVAHLSRQFKNVTGLTPSEYMRTSMSRKGLNEV